MNDYAKPAAPGWRGIDWAGYEGDFSLGGRRLHYVDVGSCSGSEVFILVHGMGGRWQH
ncbi:hypothetical protein [Streptomyces sp. WAC00263]|uniref:hypothetical protein n=1 Tax=Streptomyces sp. WAC00263 TaxID=1917422 RepID=UPI0019D5DDC0|nr:hypothetical protein [Streptomyces sp. WAC00263]